MAFGDLRATLAAMNFEMTINQFNRLKDDRYVEARIRKKSRKIYVNGKWSLMRVKFLFVANLQQSNPFYFFFSFVLLFFFFLFFFFYRRSASFSRGPISRTFQFLILLRWPAIRYAVQAGQATGQHLPLLLFPTTSREHWAENTTWKFAPRFINSFSVCSGCFEMITKSDTIQRISNSRVALNFAFRGTFFYLRFLIIPW